MSTGKIVSLRACPTVWADLCFEVGGIVGQSNVVLGQTVNAFDFASFYSTLGVAVESFVAKVKGQRNRPRRQPQDLWPKHQEPGMTKAPHDHAFASCFERR
jgi:hypothetical protein